MRSLAEVTCREIVEVVTDYLTGAMSLDDRVTFEQHIHYCTGCGHYLDQMRRTVELTGTLGDEALTDEARRLFGDLFRAWKRRRR